MSQSVAEISARLQNLQRKRAVVIKSRIMQANRLQAIIAGTLGYWSGMKEAERRKMFVDADKKIKAVLKGTENHEFEDIIRTTHIGIGEFEHLQGNLEKMMGELAKALPVAAWVKAPEQRGFGLLMLAIVIGETGDLAGYANPAKVWRRLGCAPYTFNGKTAMGATWKSGREGKLTAEEWERFGYSPRRRSIAYLIGECIVKQNGSVRINEERGDTDLTAVGPYRARYDEAKAAAALAHPDWTPKRCHLHGMLLGTKRLLRELWKEWNSKREGVCSLVTETEGALSPA